MTNAVAFVVYILQCSEGSYYVGLTDDLPAPLELHNTGKGAAWTGRRRPVKLVYSEVHRSLPDALSRERQIKKWSRAKKEALASGDISKLKELSERRT